MEAQQGRRAARGKAREIILPGSVPTPLRESDHSALWEAVSGIRVDLAEVKGRVSIILLGVAAIFASVIGLLVAQVFG